LSIPGSITFGRGCKPRPAIRLFQQGKTAPFGEKSGDLLSHSTTFSYTQKFLKYKKLRLEKLIYAWDYARMLPTFLMYGSIRADMDCRAVLIGIRFITVNAIEELNSA